MRSLRYVLLVVFLFFVSYVTNNQLSKTARSPSELSNTGVEGAEVLGNLSTERQKEFRIIAENVAKYMLEATDKNENQQRRIFFDAQKYLQFKMYQFFQNIDAEKKGLEKKAFVSIVRPPSWTLKDEIKYMNQEVRDFDPFLKRSNIELYRQKFKKVDLKKIIPSFEKSDIGLEKRIFEFLSNAQKKSVDFLHYVEHDFPIEVMSVSAKELEKYTKRIRHLGDELVDSGKVEFTDPRIKKFMRMFINDYYQSLDDDVVKTIISDFISLGPDPTDDQMIKAMISNSGPALGKTFQQLSKDPGIGVELARKLEHLEADGKEVPSHLAIDMIKKDKGGYRFISIDPKALGTGTVAQVQRAHIKYGGKQMDVAVRFLKPEVEKRAKQEIAFFRKFINDKIIPDKSLKGEDLPDFEMILEKIKSFVEADMDIPGGIKKQQLAKKIYQRTMEVSLANGKKWTLDIRVPDVYPPEAGEKTKLHVQELILEGDKFSKLDNADAQKAVARGIFSMWFEEALFKSGFIHYDLHQGNFKTLVKKNNTAKIFIFDYGMVTQIDKAVQRSFMLFGTGAEFDNPKLLVKAIMSMNDPKLKDSPKFMEKLISVIKFQSKDYKNKFQRRMSTEEWILWALDKGFIDSDEIGALARGGALVGQLPVIVGENDFSDQAIKDIGKRNMLSSIVGKRDKFPLSTLDSVNVIKGGCRDMIRTFLRH